MRVLFIGDLDATSTSLYYYHSLVRLGHSVTPLDPKLLAHRDLWSKVSYRIRKGPSPSRLREIHNRLEQLCQSNRFELIFVMSENFLSAETLNAMRAAAGQACRILYHSHDNNFSAGIQTPADFENNLRAYDIVFTTKSQNVARYKALGQNKAFFVPSAYEPSIHHPIPAPLSRYRKSFPISFVGTYDYSRDEVIERVGVGRIYIWGNGWQKSPLRKQLNLVDHAIYCLEYSDVISHSDCVLGLLRKEAEDLHTQRTFEIPACGALQIAPRNDEIRSFFEEDREIVCFDSADELSDKVDFYLRNPSAREKIAEAGYARCLGDRNTYQDRTLKMLSELKHHCPRE